MSRIVPANIARSIQAQETGEVYLHLITVTSADLPGPLRFVDNTEAIASRGEVYSPAPFRIALPSDLSGEIRSVTLQIDAVNGEIIAAIRSATSKIQILLECIVASAPDVVLASADFDVLSSSYQAATAQLSLGFEPILFEPFPSTRFTPTTAPGLY